MKHLWEIKHSYYSSEGNYFSDECHTEYEDWELFFEKEGDSNFDLNLIYRWDWMEGERYDLPEFNGDDHCRNGVLLLFFVGQKKALLRSVSIEVCRADELKVIEFLKPRFEHLKKLWEPL
jgi:hypothetical protein